MQSQHLKNSPKKPRLMLSGIANKQLRYRIFLLGHFLVGFLGGIFIPLIGSLAESLWLSGEFSQVDFWAAYTSIPFVLKIAGPFVLGLVGLGLGVLSLRLYRRQEHYLNTLKTYSEQLEQQNESLAELNSALDQMIYTTSHDLKTPVVNFKSMLAMLRMLQEKPDSEAMVENVMQKMEDSTERFLLIINNLLDVSRLERVEEPVRVIDLKEMVEKVLHDLGSMEVFLNASIEIETQKAPKIRIAEDALRSILQHLLENAGKFSRKETPLQLAIRSRIEEGKLSIEVEDNGQGIDLETHGDKLFTMFTRFQNETEGSGVGLYIVKKLVTKYGGNVAVKSRSGAGSTFILTFPETCIV